MENEFDGAPKIEDAKLPGYIVYRYLQPSTGKMYVGITKQGSIKRRAKQGTEYQKCPHLYAAIQKYGWDSFIKEVLGYGLTKEEAESWEKYFIEKWDLTNPDKGYNIQRGGVGGLGKSPEGIQSLKEHNSGLSANKQRPVCVFDLEGNKIGEFPLISFAADYFGIKRGTIINSLRRGNHPCFGMIFKYADEVVGLDRLPQAELAKILHRKSISGENNYRASPIVVFDVICGNRVGEYPTIKEAKAHYRGDIQGCLTGKQRSFGGRYTARYARDVLGVDVLPESERFDPSQALPNYRKQIAQYSLSEELIAVYNSASEASRATGLGYSAICLCASGATKSSGGFKWAYI